MKYAKRHFQGSAPRERATHVPYHKVPAGRVSLHGYKGPLVSHEGWLRVVAALSK